MLKNLCYFLAFLIFSACNSRTPVLTPPTKTEKTTQYMNCVMSERERLHKLKKSHAETEIIGEVQKICNAKVLNIK
jgi:hypothetical protein